MKFFYKLESISDVNNLLKSIAFIKSNNSNVININTKMHDTKRLAIEFPPLYLAYSNVCKTNNKYVCYELLLSLTSINPTKTEIINLFLSELENICMTYVKNNKNELFNIKEALVFKSITLEINNTDDDKNVTIDNDKNKIVDNNSSSDNISHDSSKFSNNTSNHFESDQEYFTFSDSKPIIHDLDNVYSNGGIKLKIINCKNFKTKVYDEDNKLINRDDYFSNLNKECFIKPCITLWIWKYENIVGLYLRPHSLQILSKK